MMSASPASAEDTALLLDPRRFTVDEYHRLIAAGILDEDEHVELLEGVITAMSPHGGPHARCIQWLNRYLIRTLPDAYVVRPQLPLTLRPRNEPEPDLAVVSREAAEEHAHPSTALLAVEVSGGSLRIDRKVKTGVYSRAGIPEYWIGNVEARAVEVFTDPDPKQRAYRRVRTVPKTETLSSETLPQLSFPVAELFA
jgi:Uma2 family endonuclease